MRGLRPQAPITRLSGAGDVPEQARKRVDALVAKDRLVRQLLRLGNRKLLIDCEAPIMFGDSMLSEADPIEFCKSFG